MQFSVRRQEASVSDDASGEVTRLLMQWGQGDQKALSALLPLVYDELRRVARAQLSRERPDHTLQSTALVNEAYVRLLGSQPPELRNRPHFVAIASRLIRQVLVDYARERGAGKRDGGMRVPVEHLEGLSVADDGDLLSLNEALNDLYRTDERQAKIVDMKFFGGLTSPEVSEVLGLSRATVDREWATARAWLRRELSRTGNR
jgi:RNA polymerase sigma factor (TIGR02999 family)